MVETLISARTDSARSNRSNQQTQKIISSNIGSNEDGANGIRFKHGRYFIQVRQPWKYRRRWKCKWRIQACDIPDSKHAIRTRKAQKIGVNLPGRKWQQHNRISNSVSILDNVSELHYSAGTICGLQRRRFYNKVNCFKITAINSDRSVWSIRNYCASFAI